MKHRCETWIELDDRSLDALVGRGLRARGDEVAVVDDGTGDHLSGNTMLDWIGAEAERFRRAGLRPEDVIGLVGPGSAAWLATAFGALGAGLTVVPLNAAAPARLASSQLTAAHATAIVTAAETAAWAGEVAGGHHDVMAMTERADRAPVDASSEASASSHGEAFLLASSGTTGLPKLVRITHGSIGASVQLVASAVGLRPDDAVIDALPLFHAGGLIVAATTLAAGARLVVQPTFRPDAFAAAIERCGVTGTVVVPPMCHALLAHPAVVEHDLSGLRFVQSTAAPLAESVQVRLAERLGCHVGQGLGLTEALPISLSDPDGPPVAGSCGRAVPNTELRLVDPDTGADVGGPEVIGELWVRGPQVMAGYHDDPDATAATLTDDGWLRTGDLCRIDDGGNVFVVDRLKELIKVNGFQVAPAALEAELLSHPGVVDCAVVGRPDERRGEVPVAWIVTDRSVDTQELIESVADRTQPYARLDRVVEVDTIPRSPAGKILRRELREPAPSPS